MNLAWSARDLDGSFHSKLLFSGQVSLPTSLPHPSSLFLYILWRFPGILIWCAPLSLSYANHACECILTLCRCEINRHFACDGSICAIHGRLLALIARVHACNKSSAPCYFLCTQCSRCFATSTKRFRYHDQTWSNLPPKCACVSFKFNFSRNAQDSGFKIHSIASYYHLFYTKFKFTRYAVCAKWERKLRWWCIMIRSYWSLPKCVPHTITWFLGTIFREDKDDVPGDFLRLCCLVCPDTSHASWSGLYILIYYAYLTLHTSHAVWSAYCTRFLCVSEHDFAIIQGSLLTQNRTRRNWFL